jgi:hypothetical protein
VAVEVAATFDVAAGEEAVASSTFVVADLDLKSCDNYLCFVACDMATCGILEGELVAATVDVDTTVARSSFPCLDEFDIGLIGGGLVAAVDDDEFGECRTPRRQRKACETFDHSSHTVDLIDLYDRYIVAALRETRPNCPPLSVMGEIKK